MRDSLNFEAGERHGTLSEKFATAKRMLSLNFTLSEIMEATQLSLNDLNSLVLQA
ncbi:MAG: hypothetical protein IJ667_07555 [Synergistaceae bacterium]|nr:hypothetical protein [Synergistaceae bacterium]